MKKSGIISLSVIFAVCFLPGLVLCYIAVFGGKLTGDQFMGAVFLGCVGVIASIFLTGPDYGCK